MRKIQLIPLTLSSLLLASPVVIAEEAHHPETTAEGPATVATPAPAPTEAPGDAAPGSEPTATQGSGMMRPGMSGQGGGMTMPGMKQKWMMGGMQGMGGGPGSGMIQGGPGMGMGGMMKGGQGMGCKMHQGMKGGHCMLQKHRDLESRLDLIDARLAKIETLLERLMQR
jgi:hypothetical protein